MKSVIVDLGQDVFYPGDFIALSHTSPGGGRNTVKYKVDQSLSVEYPKIGVTPEVVAKELAAAINGGSSEWNSGSFQAVADDTTIMIMVNDAAGEVVISGSCERVGSPQITFKVTPL